MKNSEHKTGWLWAAFGAVSMVAAYFLVVRPKHLTWGAELDEVDADLPGDGLIPDGQNCATHAVTIDASPADVWPWIAQLGQDKAGFYSYTFLENLVGCDMHNADSVHLEWQNPQAGDLVRFHPKYPLVPLAEVEPGSHLVFGADLQRPNGTSWAIILRPAAGGKCRLIARLRCRNQTGLGRLAQLFVAEPAHFIMERKMMLTIKALSERASLVRAAA